MGNNRLSDGSIYERLGSKCHKAEYDLQLAGLGLMKYWAAPICGGYKSDLYGKFMRNRLVIEGLDLMAIHPVVHAVGDDGVAVSHVPPLSGNEDVFCALPQVKPAVSESRSYLDKSIALDKERVGYVIDSALNVMKYNKRNRSDLFDANGVCDDDDLYPGYQRIMMDSPVVVARTLRALQDTNLTPAETVWMIQSIATRCHRRYVGSAWLGALAWHYPTFPELNVNYPAVNHSVGRMLLSFCVSAASFYGDEIMGQWGSRTIRSLKSIYHRAVSMDKCHLYRIDKKYGDEQYYHGREIATVTQTRFGGAFFNSGYHKSPEGIQNGWVPEVWYSPSFNHTSQKWHCRFVRTLPKVASEINAELADRHYLADHEFAIHPTGDMRLVDVGGHTTWLPVVLSHEECAAAIYKEVVNPDTGHYDGWTTEGYVWPLLDGKYGECPRYRQFAMQTALWGQPVTDKHVDKLYESLGWIRVSNMCHFWTFPPCMIWYNDHTLSASVEIDCQAAVSVS